MNLFQMASRGVDLDALPEDDAPRAPIDFGPSAAPAGRMAVPQEFDSLFDAAASEYGVDPTILKGIAYAESRFRPDVIDGTTKSSAGALGLMQFMPATAKEMGINPLDPAEAVFGAAAYLRQSLDKFGGDTERAIASYNWGRNRSAFDREDWYKNLPAETRNYVGTVLEFADNVAPVAAPAPVPQHGIQVPLPDGVSPTTHAGAGRGTVDDPRRIDNPDNQQKPFLSRVADSATDLVKTAAAANPVLGRFMKIADGPVNTPSGSVLIDQPVVVGGANPNDLAENERLSRRDYAEQAAQRQRIANSPEMRAPVPLSRAQAYAEQNPNKAALFGDSARTMAGALNAPSVLAGLGAEAVNRAATDAGGAPVFNRVPNMPLVNDLRKVTQDYTSQLSRKNPGQAWDDGEFGRWMMTQMSGNSISAGMSLAALFLPGAQATILGSMGATAAGSAYADGDSASAAAMKGLVEIGSEKLPLHAAEKIKDLVLAIPASARNQVLAEAGKRLLAAGTAVSANSLVGAIEETAAEIGGNAIDKYVSGKNKSLFEDVDRAALVGAAFGGGMSAPAIMDTMSSPQAKAARELAGALQGDLPAAGGTVAELLRTNQNNTAQIDPVATSRAAATGEVARLQAQPAPQVQDQPTTPQAPVVTQRAPDVPQAPVETAPGAQATQAVSNIQAQEGAIAQPTAAPAASAVEQAAATVEQAEQQLAARESAQAQPAAPVSMEMRSTGTLLVKGDPVALRKRLAGAGVDNTVQVGDDLVVARSQAVRAQEVLSAQPQSSPPTAAPLQTPVAEVRNVPQSTPQAAQQPAEAASPAAPVVGRTDAPVPAGAVPAAGGAATAQADGVTGQKIDSEWTAFAPESGTRAVPRSEMPQIKAEHRGAMVNFLKARGVGAAQEEVPAASLKPTQAEFSPAKVAQAKAYTGGDRSILVSSDGYVLDGHHQWLAKREAGEPVKVIRLDAPIADLLPLVKEFPSSTQAEGATAPQESTNADSTAPGVRLADEQPSSAAPAAQAGQSEPAGRPADAQPDARGPAGRSDPAQAVAGVQPAVPAGSGGAAADPVTRTPAFQRWFGGSKVADAEGKPLVVYHGTTASFDAFNDGTGWFTVDPGEANFWGGMKSEGANVMPAYLSIKNPRVIDASEASRNRILDALAALQGDEDGVVVMEDGKVRWAVVSDPKQVKSATGNNGQFDPANPDIRYSKGMSRELAEAIMAVRPPARAQMATKDSVQAALDELVGAGGRLPGGRGRIVVANAAEIKPTWEPIIGKVDIASEDSGRAQGFYDHKTKTIFLIADHIKAGQEAAVAAHELLHKHGEAVLGAEGWKRLQDTVELWADAPEGSTERQVYDEAVARVEASRPGDISIPEYTGQELLPYATQVAIEMGIKPSITKPVGTVEGWLGHLRGVISRAWEKITGNPELFKSQDLVDLVFAVSQRENPAIGSALDNATTQQTQTAAEALEQISNTDGLFSLPKSDAMTVEQLVAEVDPDIKVTVTPLGDETMYTLKMPDGGTATLTERAAGADPVYGRNEATGRWITERPGENAEAVAGKGDVWIDVSDLKPGRAGGVIYNIAANYAHNTGQVFIGDPSGLKDIALRRRAEQMLASALKFGTTEHLAPHPRQIVGDAALGVPPLRWVYSDDAANIQSLIDVNQTALENGFPDARNLRYDLDTGNFYDEATGRSLSIEDMALAARGARKEADAVRAGAGWRTVARGAVFRAILGAGTRSRAAESEGGRNPAGSGRGGVLDGAVSEPGGPAQARNREQQRSRGTLEGLVREVGGLRDGDPGRRIFYSRTTADDLKSSMGAMTPDQEAAWSKAAGLKTPPTLKERAAQMKANFSTKARQGIVDQFAPIADLDQKAYMLARMSKGSDGTMEAALLYGRPFLRDGVPDVDVNEGGFARVLAGLKGEHDRFLWWVAALRAENLKAQGKENLLDTPDIDALKTLNAGTMADGTGRAMTYAEALLELNDFNNAVLQMAKDSGLIDQAAVDLFKDQPYVPFYRLADETGQMQGPRFSAGLTNQKAWKKLKGGTQQINADLLQNMLMNWSSLYGAAARNRAALATMDAAEQMAVAYQVPEGTKGAAKVMRDGVTEHWAVEDPYLLEAISALNYTPSPLMKALSKPKQLLTWGVTVNPTFKIRNLIRDSVSAIAMADLNYNFVGNAVKGWKLMDAESQTYASMLASGGVIKFGTQENTDRLRNKVAKLGGIVLDQGASAKLWGQAKGVWEAYQELGDKSENVNRAALYDRLIKKGHSHAEASFMARDLMDFSMGGNLPIVRFLTQTVPFLNARLQGLYKLGRAAGEDPARFAAVVGAVSVASLILLAMYHDDDDWKKREDWDRDGYWWIKIGSTAYRIPKPFEVGALGTLAERTAELIFSKEMDNKRFMERLRHMLASTFSLDPIPQAIKPLLDVSANKDSFTGRAIETQADQKLRPKDRYSERTPEIARLLGSWGLPDPLRLVKGEWSGLSPKQIEHLLRGYFSWAATATFAVTDAGASLVTDKGEKPDLRLKDMFLAGNFVETLPSGSSRYVSKMYEQAKDAEQAYASYQAAVKAGDKDRVAEIRTKDLDKLKSRELLHEGTQALARINLYSRMVEADKKMTGEQKRKRLDELEQQRHKIAQKVIGAGAEGRTQSK